MHFRDACSRDFSGVAAAAAAAAAAAESPGYRVRGEEDIQLGILDWRFDDDAYVYLSVSMPGTEGRISIRVEAQVVSVKA